MRFRKEIASSKREEDNFHCCEVLLDLENFITTQESLENGENEPKREFYLRRTIHPSRKASQRRPFFWLAAQ